MSELSNLAREVETPYLKLRNDLFRDPELREVLAPLDDAREVIAKKRATLATIAQEYAAGRLAADQVPKLRASVIADIRSAQEAADRAARKRAEELPVTLTARAFRAPPRGPQTAEAKGDTTLKVDAAKDVRTGALAALDAAVQSRDALAVPLLASDWGADLFASRTDPETARVVRDEVRARAAQDAEDLFPEAARADLARLRRMGDVSRALALGLNLLDMERQSIERGDLGDNG